MTRQRPQSGFALITVLIFSLAALIILSALLAATSGSYSGSRQDHYQQLAQEAAEAGTAYATACLSVSSHSQTWGPAASKPNLAPRTDCNGATSYSSNQYVYSDSHVRTYFTVGDLDYTAQFGAQVSATGYTDVLRADGNVVKTYQSTQKKVLQWPTDVTVQAALSGTRRTCAIVSYQVYCWGMNGYGELGNGQYDPQGGSPENPSPVDSHVPVKVKQDPGVMSGKKIAKIFVAQFHTCALSEDGLMYCWGWNANGQLGDGTTTDRSVPVQVKGALTGKTITDIGGSNNATCAIADGKIYCWGINNNGLTGNGSTSGNTTNPTLVSATNTSTTLPSNYTATALSTSGSRSQLMCAVAGGKAYCWGRNNVGSVGDNTTTNRSVPTKVYDGGVLSGKTVTRISQDGYISDASGGGR